MKQKLCECVHCHSFEAIKGCLTMSGSSGLSPSGSGWACESMQVAECAVTSDSVTLRKQALDLACMQLRSQAHQGHLCKVALLMVKAGMSSHSNPA